MRNESVWIIAGLAFALSACGTAEKSPRGFRLPDGSAERGQAAFVELKCTSCHRLDGARMSEWGTALAKPVRLGGDVLYAKSDGELVTAIINPSHDLIRGYPSEVIQIGGKSRMKDYAGEMTVQQLIDIVAFLHTKYRTVPAPVGNY